MLTLLAIVAIAAYVTLNYDAAVSTLVRLDWRGVLAAALIMCTLHPLIAISFYLLHKSMGMQRKLGRAFQSYFGRLIARFLPGGVWHSVMRYADLALEQSQSPKIVTVFLFESALLASTGFLATGLAGLARSALAAPFFILEFTIGVISIIIFAFVWRWRFKKHGPVPFALAIFLMTAVWTGAAFAFAALTTTGAHAMLTGCSPLPIAAAYLGASSLGYVVVFAPQGWGVTEFVFALLRPCDIAPASAVTAVLSFRILSLACDGASFLSYQLANSFQKRLQHVSETKP